MANPTLLFCLTASQKRLPLLVNRCRPFASVTGTAYASESPDAPVVKLFTKEDCHLCDDVKEVLIQVRDDFPHTLEQIDITDEENAAWFSKYKYDIPVLHLCDKFWIKHRLSLPQAEDGLKEAQSGTFQEREGQPDAGALEARQAERRKARQNRP